VAAERAAVKGYLDELKRGTLPRPRCPVEGCARRPQRRGFRDREDVRDSSGDPLGPVPVPRYRCTEHGGVPWHPGCLLPYVRTVAVAVEEAVEGYAGGKSAAQATAGSAFDERCVRRWVSRLAAPGVEAWVEIGLDALRPDPAALGERPARARPGLWRTLDALRRLAAALRERNIAVGSPLSLLWSRPAPLTA